MRQLFILFKPVDVRAWSPAVRALGRTLATLSMMVIPASAQSAKERHINDAEIIGQLSDGRPSPAPKAREFPDFEIKRAKSHMRSEHRIVLHQVGEPDLPKLEPTKPRKTKEEIEALFNSDEFLKLKQEAENNPVKFGVVSATVYGKTKTHLHWWYDGHSFEAWSNVDFNYLSGFHQFEGRGKRFIFLMGLGSAATKNSNVRKKLPEIPNLPSLSQKGPSYLLVEGDETNVEALTFMDVLHDLYEKDSERLKAAHKERVKNRQIREEKLRNNPPKKEDSQFYFWKKGERK